MATLTSYSNLHALVIDDMPSQQTTLRGLLGMLGISQVETANSVDSALRLISVKRFGLILCDYNLNGPSDGQQLLEHLRERQLLPPDCQFLMVSAEAAYAQVASATEHRPDAYLLKPITAADIAERLGTVLERRQAMRGVHQAVERKDWAKAIDECEMLLATRSRWSMFAMQTKGQALLQLGRHEEAKAVYEQALAVRSSLAWAQLGLARACKAAQQLPEATALAKAVLAMPDGGRNVEAFDLLAECQEEQGDGAAALATLQRSAEVLPSSRRQRRVAEAAYRQGDLEVAKESYARVVKATRGSIAGQPTDVMALAQTLVDRGEAAEALAALDEASRANPKAPAQAGAMAVRAQALAAQGDAAGAAAAASRARELLVKPRADLATVAVARAELSQGRQAEGLALLTAAVKADHENTRLASLVGRALDASGLADRRDDVLHGAMRALDEKVAEAKRLFRSTQTAEALALIEEALREVPENTAVLLQAAQMHCMALRLTRAARNDPAVSRVQQYLARLDKLLPGHDRVLRMRRYFSETLAALETQAA